MVFLFNLGGVPVLSLPTFKGRDLSFFASLSLEGSPKRPPEDWSRPVCRTPPRKVPVVKIIAPPKISSPVSVITDLMTEFFMLKSTIEAAFMVRFSEFKSIC